jgi:hypothetical protein
MATNAICDGFGMFSPGLRHLKFKNPEKKTEESVWRHSKDGKLGRFLIQYLIP